VIHQPNGGVSSARNAGIFAATGAYFAWVDPDDYVSPEWFPAIREVLVNHAPDVILIDSVKFGLGAEQPEIYGRPAGFVEFDTFYSDVLRDIRIRNGLPNKIMKAELFRDVTFDTRLTILEDFAALPEILRSANTVFYIPKCLYYYRQHPSSLLHHASAELAFRSVEVAIHRMEAMDNNYRKPAATAAVWQAFSFLRTAALTGKSFSVSGRRRMCRRFIRRNLWPVLQDEELSVSIKCKILLSTLGAFPLIVKLMSRSE
jgi:glycosyltransferase involved in cell wall biosynthesis